MRICTLSPDISDAGDEYLVKRNKVVEKRE